MAQRDPTAAGMGIEELRKERDLYKALAEAKGAVRREHTCLRCSAHFTSGAGTDRRAHAKYCSDRCRVAAYRLRKAAAESSRAAALSRLAAMDADLV